MELWLGSQIQDLTQERLLKEAYTTVSIGDHLATTPMKEAYTTAPIGDYLGTAPDERSLYYGIDWRPSVKHMFLGHNYS